MADPSSPSPRAPRIALERPSPREDPQQVPRPSGGGLVIVDTTWGELNPLDLGNGVKTVGEPEVIEHVETGGFLADTRSQASFEDSTIPGALNLPPEDGATRANRLPPGGVLVLFCNGPQCPATPSAIEDLIGAGIEPERLRYYRGGMHDWITLGLPTVSPTESGGDEAGPN
ncbi:MAG: rhodanese-like domain-containing protein [Solirubrobacterales bacterium]